MDCVRILAMLKEMNVHGSEVAQILNIDHSTVSLWKKGQLPREPHGRRLIALFHLYYPAEKIPALVDNNHPQQEVAHI